MSSPQNNDHKSSEGCHKLSPNMLMHHHQQQQQQQHLLHMQQQMQHFQTQQQQQHQQQQQLQQQQQQHYQDTHVKHTFDSESSLAQKRNLYAIKEQEEDDDVPELVENKRQKCHKSEVLDIAYDADVDDDIPMRSVTVVMTTTESCVHDNNGGDGVMEKAQKAINEKQHIYELFQPWALKTYGDQAKTKTITMRKKVRILKALEGKEHSRPDSSKFRFWVKTKGFTTKRPESFEDAPCTQRHKKPLPPNAILSDNPAEVDLYVASTNKDFEKRHYRKVAVVEEFFDIIYNIHMELGGRSGMHAGQKRTYRIISETYAFLPREAVTRFLSICPECKKNLRPSSPSTSSAHLKEEALMVVAQNESSSEIEVLNYSSHTESSLEAGPTTKTLTQPSTTTGALHMPLAQAKKRRYSNPDNNSKAFVVPLEHIDPTHSLPRRNSSPLMATVTAAMPQSSSSNLPKIRINPNLQRPFTPPILETAAFAQPHYGFGFDFHSLKSRDNLVRYYEFMRRLYAGNLMTPTVNLPQNLQPPPPVFHKDILPSFSKPNTTNVTCKKSLVKTLESSISSSSEDDNDNITVLTAKRFKSSPESSETTKALVSAPLQLQIPTIDKDFIQTTQIRAINLSKNSCNFSSSSKNDTEPKTPTTTTANTSSIYATTSMPLTSTPTSIKKEAVTPPKSSTLSSAIRIPQLRTVTGLPPLDFERLKPITSTYLQLTRSMGLSDEEALRFDNLKILAKIMLQIKDTSNS